MQTRRKWGKIFKLLGKKKTNLELLKNVWSLGKWRRKQIICQANKNGGNSFPKNCSERYIKNKQAKLREKENEIGQTPQST